MGLNSLVKVVAALGVSLSAALICAQQFEATADATELRQLFVGSWLINDELSDNTDDQVEEAIKAGGGKVSRRWFSKRSEDYYRGGPEEQELYDRVSYDDVLHIEHTAPEFIFTYADEYQRVFHTDGRRRSTTANSFYAGGGADFSFGNWDGAALVVEARPRDGGFTLERYTLNADGQRLRVEMVIEPDSFRAAINLTRVYDRAK
ncbi:MAG: hypothetical protein WDZ52_01980 [Pseudohongiellaceae bacterium]